MAIEKNKVKETIIETISLLEIYYELISGLEIGEKVVDKKSKLNDIERIKLGIRKSSFDSQMQRINNLKSDLVPLLNKNIQSLELNHIFGISEYKEEYQIEADEAEVNLFSNNS